MSQTAFDPEKKLEELLKLHEEEIDTNPESIGEKPGTPVHDSTFNFNIKPKELEEFLNKYVVSQKETIEVIATKVCTHFNKMKLEKELNFSSLHYTYF